MNIKLTTKFNDKEIRQDITHDFMKLAETKIMYLKDEHVRRALKELGWISPEELKNDTHRLNKMQEMMTGYGNGWILRMLSNGRGLRLHESEIVGSNPDIREAIDKYISERNEI